MCLVLLWNQLSLHTDEEIQVTERLRHWTKVTAFRRELARAPPSDVFGGPHSSLNLPLSHRPVTWFPQCLPQGAPWDHGTLWGAVHLVLPVGGWSWHLFLSATKLGTSCVGRQPAPRPPRTSSPSPTHTPLHSPHAPLYVTPGSIQLWCFSLIRVDAT